VTDSLHKYTITVDSTQASAAITSVETALQKSESAAIKAGASVDKVATDWGKAANALKERTEKGAAAMAILAQTMGNAESAGGKLVAGAGTLAATYGAGGPWMVALVAGAGAIEFITKKMNEQLDAQDRLLEKNSALVASYHDIGIAATKSILSSDREKQILLDAGTGPNRKERADELRAHYAFADDVQKIDQDIATKRAAIDVELTRKGLAYDEIKTATLQSELDALEAARGSLERELYKRLEIVDVNKKLEESDAARAKSLKTIEERSQAMVTAFDKIKKSLEEAAKASAEQRAKAADFNLDQGFEAELAMVRQRADDISAQEEAATSAAEKIVDAERKKMEDIARLSDKAREDLRKDEELKQKYAERAQEKILEGEKAMRAQMEQMAIGSYGIIAGASQQLVADLITGQDHALEHFATSIMAQAGQSLISNAVQLAGAATVSAFTGNAPVAIAQGSAAAGLFAGGLALGGLAVGAEHVMAGGSIGQKLPDQKSGTPAGFGGRSSSGGNQGSGTNVTIVYSGASGPSADDGARAVTMALTLAQRRGQYNNNLDRRF